VAGDVEHLERLTNLRGPLPRLSFDEAATKLDRDPGAVVWSEGGAFRNLTRRGEHALMDQFGGFVWVTHWDHLAVPFYQAFGDPGHVTALNADLLFGIGETVGAGERHVSDVELTEALDLHGIDAEPYAWYADMKREAPMRTAGFGLGIERLLLWVLKHDDIRDMQLLPRTNGRRDIP
jgi:asparaginyl-tRNA synthetase